MRSKGNNAQLQSRFDGLARRLLKRLGQVLQGRPAPDAKQVFFIAGVQRSGTNMIVNMLTPPAATEVFRETDPRAYRDFELRDIDTLRRLVARSHGRITVFKALCELQILPALLDAFPRAKALWIVRRPEDMINSHLRARFSVNRTVSCGERMRNIVDGRDPEGWRGRDVGETTLAAIRDLTHEGLSHASGVGLFWLMRNRLYFDLGLDRDERVRAVCYEDLVTAPDGHTAALFDWLGLPFRRSLHRKVNPGSIGRYPPPDVERPILKACHDLHARFRTDARLLEPIA
ncbi:MAG: sulfotransferase [Rhodothalassiaceae bacterium]